MDMFHLDAHIMTTTNAARQRYSERHDGLVFLDRDGAHYVMRSPSGAEHWLAVEYTDEARLAAHWTGFCRACDVTR